MSWSAIKGHDRAVRLFQAAWRRGRLGQAYLFTGQRGIGKRTFARELAKALLCEGQGAELEACDKCSSCILVNAGTHPDVLFAEKPEEKNELPIDTIRALCDQLALKPAMGIRRAAIVDNADGMNEESANCFLKTLEEPSPGSLLILIGGATPDKQIRTILSRCQLIPFASLSERHVREVLRSRAKEDHAVDELAIALAAGSVGLSVEFSEPAFQEVRQKLLNDLSIPNNDLFEWAESWLKSVDDLSEDSAGQRRASHRLLHIMTELFRRSWRWHLGLEDTDANTLPFTRPLANRYSQHQLAALLIRLQDTAERIDRMAQLNYTIESLAWELMTV